MIFQLTTALLLSVCLNQVTSYEVTDWELDKADLICAAKLNVMKEEIYSVIDINLKIINPDDDFVKKYTKCWMFEQGMIDSAGNLNLGVYKTWYTTFGYGYLRKDNEEKYKIEDRGIGFDKAVVDCQTQLGVVLNIKDKEPYFFNCIISTIVLRLTQNGTRDYVCGLTNYSTNN